jgi:hypothetical protein
MAATKEPENGVTTHAGVLDEAAARIRDLNERLLDGALAAGSKTVDAYERALSNLVSVTAGKEHSATPLEWLTALAQIHAEFVRDVSMAYTAALRVLLD